MNGKRENHISNKELMVFSSNLKPVLEPVISRLGFALLDVLLVKEFESIYLRITIEHPDRLITLDDCEAVSHEAGKELDKKNSIPFQYILEVQSKGIDPTPVIETKHEFILDKLGLVVKS